ncbi:MAG TPA: YscO family type III secretion system apparatus protein [Geminicoccaceae bacterium]|nr:YscO family type III secretion system apparatus protein [Geminicoccaceae bacterium]
MHDVIGRIVDVKEMREDRAGDELRRCRMALETAARRVEQSRRELADYQAWRVRRENEMFDAIEQKLVRLRELEDLKTDIGLLRGKEQVYHEKILEAEKARQDAHQAVGTAENALELAVKARQKFEELADWLDAEARAYRERVEELELEEQFSVVKAEIDGEDRFAQE